MKKATPYYLLIALVVLSALIYLFSKSLFITAPSRLQVVVYGPDARVYSIDTRGTNHYMVHFTPDERIQIPGNYGYYRVGSIGKLISLEHKPEIASRAFSHATSSFVTYYFLPSKPAIYYGDDRDDQVAMPNLWDLMTYTSNARMFDRIYILMHFVQAKSSDYLALSGHADESLRHGIKILKPDVFTKKFAGYLYNPTYRAEHRTVQIYYTDSYNTAAMVGTLMEGNGVRVVDIAQHEATHSPCQVTEAGKTHSETARVLSQFFGCRLESGTTEISDIIIDMRRIESVWKVVD